jgi:hypothetical protein
MCLIGKYGLNPSRYPPLYGEFIANVTEGIREDAMDDEPKSGDLPLPNNFHQPTGP